MIGTPGDLVLDLPCLQLASYLEGGPLLWMMLLHLHVSQKEPMMMMMMITFTSQCIEHPGKPHCIMGKVGFTGVYIIFLNLAQKHIQWVLVRTALMRQF